MICPAGAILLFLNTQLFYPLSQNWGRFLATFWSPPGRPLWCDWRSLSRDGGQCLWFPIFVKLKHPKHKNLWTNKVSDPNPKPKLGPISCDFLGSPRPPLVMRLKAPEPRRWPMFMIPYFCKNKLSQTQNVMNQMKSWIQNLCFQQNRTQPTLFSTCLGRKSAMANI